MDKMPPVSTQLTQIKSNFLGGGIAVGTGFHTQLLNHIHLPQAAITIKRKMPCHADCYLRRILLTKEMKISKLQQVDRWVDTLYRQELQRRNKIIVKKAVVANQIDTIQSEAGELVTKLANGCASCNAH